MCEFPRFYTAIVDWLSDRSSNDLTKLAIALTKNGRAKHSRNLTWSRAFLSKSRYMCGRQCPKKLWQTVYDPEPAEEPLPGTVKGMGIEVGIKARLLWPGGVLVETSKYDDYAEAVRRTNALIADPTVPAIFEAALTHHGVLIRVDALERLRDNDPTVFVSFGDAVRVTHLRNPHGEWTPIWTPCGVAQAADLLNFWRSGQPYGYLPAR